MGTDDYLYDDPADDFEEDAFAVYEETAQRARQHAEDVLIDFDEGEYDAPDEPGWWATTRARLARTIRIIAAMVALAAGVVAVLVIRGVIPTGSESLDGPSAHTPPAPAIDIAPVTWPAQVPAQSHTIPAMIKNSLTTIGEAHGYRFEGTAGDIWRITVEPRSESLLDPMMTLYGPSGEEIARADDRSADDLSAELVITLPESGPYHLLVQSSQGGITTGDYLLSLWPE